MNKVRMMQSFLEGQVRCTDGTLVVFVEPSKVPCTNQEPHRNHPWLHPDGEVRECLGVRE